MNCKHIFLSFVLMLVLSACASVGMTAPSATPPTPTVTPAPTQIPAALTPSPAPTNPPPLPEITPTSLPTATAANQTLTYASTQFDTIPMGETASLTEGDSSYTFRVKGVYIGQQAAIKLFKIQVPDGLKLVLVVPEIKYIQGPPKKRVQLMHEDLFNAISKGHLLNNDFFQYTPVSNHLNSVTLLPGETSQGYLVFAVYKDDDQPVLRYQNQGKMYYFALTDLKLPPAALPITPTWFGDQNLGDSDHPVALGKTIAYDWNGSSLLMTVERMERGINAKKILWDYGGRANNLPAGQEYILSFIHIHLASPNDQLLEFKPALFTIYNQGKALSDQPDSHCPMPCLTQFFLYPNGDAQGWVPLITSSSDPNPLLNFNNELFFALTNPDQAQESNPVSLIFPANAIGINTIKSVDKAYVLQQHAVVRSFAFSPDDKWLASGGDDHKIHIWDTGTGQEITSLAKHNAAVTSISFSFDGKTMASVSADEEIFVWSTADWQVLQQLKQSGSGIFAGFLGNNLVTVNQYGLISVWDITTAARIKEYTTQTNVIPACSGTRLNGFDMTFDGNTFAAALDCGYGVVWNPLTNERLLSDANHANDSGQRPYTSAIALSQVGNLAAYGGSYYHHIGYLVDVSDLSRQTVLGGVGTGTTNIPAIAFSPNGEIIAAAIGSTIRTWWPNGYVWTGRKSIDLKGHTVGVTALKYSNDATLLASGDYSGQIVIWKVKSNP